MGIKGGKVFIELEDLPTYFKKYKDDLTKKGYTEYQIHTEAVLHYDRSVITKYTKDWQDANLKEWIDMILYEPEGYAKAISLMDSCSTYEHYKHVNTTSYQKGNVGNQRAKRELTPKAYDTYLVFKEFNDKNKKKENNAKYRGKRQQFKLK